MQIVGRTLLSSTARTALRGSGVGLFAAVAISASPAVAQPLPQTVQVGTQTVAVPSNGEIVVDGQTVTVMPGVTRVILAAPPAGSTPVPEDGQTTYQLPAGATGESFTYPTAPTDAVTLPTTAVFASAGANTVIPDGSESPTCEVTAHLPAANGGQATVKGTSSIGCSGYGAAQTKVQVWSSLYKWVNNEWSDLGQSPGSGWQTEDASSTFTAACKRGTSSSYHTRAGGSTIWEGLEVSDYEDDSTPNEVPCS